MKRKKRGLLRSLLGSKIFCVIFGFAIAHLDWASLPPTKRVISRLCEEGFKYKLIKIFRR